MNNSDAIKILKYVENNMCDVETICWNDSQCMKFYIYW